MIRHSLPIRVSWLLLMTACMAKALDNGLALMPPMGWLSWQRFLCNADCKTDPENCISEHLYKDMADRLVADRFLEAGYEYVNIDDCWMSMNRDSRGRLVPDPDRFPSGIKALADYIHSKGLKIGIYSDSGTKTCAGYPGSANHYATDAQTFADWGIDMLKLDGCYSEPTDMDTLYPAMTLALNQTGRGIVFSCSWPDYQRASGMQPDYKKIARHCNLWRNFDDIADSWASVTSIIDYYSANQKELVPAAGPGNWNDPDMLVIGNFGLSLDESKAQMAIWAILAAPLLMSNDLRHLAPQHKAVLLNRDIIAVNQDPLGMMGNRTYQQDKIEIWMRQVLPTMGKEYSYALVYFNRRTMGGPVKVETTLRKLGMCHPTGYNVRDLFEGAALGLFTPDDTLKVTVNPSGVVMIKAEVNQDYNHVN